VSGTLDEFASGSPLHIAREMLVPVTSPCWRALVLSSARSGCRLPPPCNRPVPALAAGPSPRARVRSAPSTAEAAAAVAEGGDGTEGAIAAPANAGRYGLVELASDIGDHHHAVTRFVMAVSPRPLPRPTGADRTTVVTMIADDHPGALLELLTEFAVRESTSPGSSRARPATAWAATASRSTARAYRGGPRRDALAALHRSCEEVRFCGSYPRADGEAPRFRHGTADADFQSAAEWLDRTRRGTD